MKPIPTILFIILIVSFTIGLFILAGTTTLVTATTSDNPDQSGDLMTQESLGFLKIGISTTMIIKNLGKPEEKSEEVTWGADGLDHQTWYYKSKGIELDIVKQANQTGRVADMITIKSPCKYQTKRGIGIGSLKSEVMKAYPKEIDTESSTNTMIVAGSIYGGVIFTMKQGKVTAIFIGAGAE